MAGIVNLKIQTSDYNGLDMEGFLYTGGYRGDPMPHVKQFDRLVKELIKVRFNNLIDELAAEQSGWIPIADTLVFVSADNPIGVLKVAGKDVTANFKAGMRLKFTNSGNTIYVIISKNAEMSGSDTHITFLHEINPGTNQALYLVANSDITNAYFSTHKAPLGFPAEPIKWTLQYTSSATLTQSAPAAPNVYNVGGASLAVPIGGWYIDYHVIVYLQSAAAKTGIDINIGLSTSPSSIGNINWMDYKFELGISYTGKMFSATRRNSSIEASKTTYYLNVRVNSNAPDALHYSGESGVTIIRAVCSYL